MKEQFARLAALALAAAAALLAAPVGAQSGKATAADAWTRIEQRARGQTVYFNAWGGGDNSNRYIAWAAQEAERRHGIRVRHVKVNDATDYIRRIQTEVAAGRTRDGSVDLVWINGENFGMLKQAGLLYGPWAEQLPNWRYVDLSKPVRSDFSLPTEGMEAPWGTAQLTFIADRSHTLAPPRSAAEWLAFARAHPGRTSYPKPPAFHGTTVLKQFLLELTDKPAVLQPPVDPAQFERITQPLWSYLDALHPLLWRGGKAFPASAADMHRMLGDGELRLSLSFNPNEAANLIATRQLPSTAYSFGFSGGTIGNVHFLAIPSNAKAKEAAQVFANFLLSPEAQVRKSDVRHWGDGSVLNPEALPTNLAAALRNKAPGGLPEGIAVLPEPHANWMNALEQAWLQRYGTR